MLYFSLVILLLSDFYPSYEILFVYLYDGITMGADFYCQMAVSLLKVSNFTDIL